MTIGNSKQNNKVTVEAAGDHRMHICFNSLELLIHLEEGRLQILNLVQASDEYEVRFSGNPLGVAGAIEWASGSPECRVLKQAADEALLELDCSGDGRPFKWYLEFRSNPLRVKGWFHAAKGTGEPAGLGTTGSSGEAAKSFSCVEWNQPNEQSVRGEDLLATVAVSEKHLRITSHHLHDITDYFDPLVESKSIHSGHKGGHVFSGNLLEVENVGNGCGFLVARLAPSPEAQFIRAHPFDFQWVNRCGLAIYGTGIQPGDFQDDETAVSYGFLLIPGRVEELPGRFRRFYRRRMQPEVFENPVILSNTWGDRNKDTALREAFVLRELEAAAQAGLGGCMLDDGWQKGTTMNSGIKPSGLWEGYHAADPHFWSVHPEKFPNGLAGLSTWAGDSGLSLALWFSPDSSNDFENWERDADLLLDIYRTSGIRCFKLDGVKFRSRTGERRFGKFLERLRSGSSGCLIPIMDVTAEIRQGYFREIRHGILFLENRYTDWGNYFPHRTLRNVWQLSRWIPAQRLHIEFLNPRRNPDRYGEDPLAPARHPISYLFAITIVGHPLAWMEVQHLHPQDRADLQPVATWFKRHQQRLLSADIEPVGTEPDGSQLTGFVFHFDKGEKALLAFCEPEAETTGSFAFSGCQDISLKYRIGSDPRCSASSSGNRLQLGFSRPASWAFLATPDLTLE